MTFADDLNKFSVTCQTRSNDVFVGCVDEAFNSVVLGSPITGAPGQPVDTGVLRASWQKYFTSPTQAQISTNVAYAEPIEDGIGRYGPMTLRSSVGGFHSVAMTIAAFSRIVSIVTQRVKDNG